MKLPDLIGSATSQAGKEILQGRPGNVADVVKGALNNGIDVAIRSATKKLPVGLQKAIGGLDTGGQFKAARNRPDPLMEVNWSVVMPLGLKPEYVEEITFSDTYFQTSEPVQRDGYNVFIAETRQVSSINITFYEDRLLTISNWLANWRQLISPDGKTRNFPSLYKQTITVFAQDVAGNRVGQFVLVGCWPAGAVQRNMASAGSERVRVVQEFSVDRVEYLVPPGSASGILSSIPGVSQVFGALNGVVKTVSSGIDIGAAINTGRKVLKF